MKITKQSEVLIKFFSEKNCITQKTPSLKTKQIILQLFHNIKEAAHFIQQHKKQEGEKFYKLQIKQIQTISQIPRPKTFNINSFPKEIREHIDKAMLYQLTYTFSLFEKDITIHFIVENKSAEKIYHDYVEKILTWLHVVNQYASKTCSKSLSLFIYLTSLKKKLPKNNIHILGENNVNTAFTYSCKASSEIVIFRQEEWFKVLIHESFHNFGLDFSDMNNEVATNKILSIYKVNSEVKLYEAYTEFWAEILNACFCSFYLSDSNESEFLVNFNYFIHLEKTYKFFQMIKTLNFMGLTYTDLYSISGEQIRNTLYKEKSNILSYYIITTVLMHNYESFLSWCDTRHYGILQFKKSLGNMTDFCDFVSKNYKTKSLLNAIHCTEEYFIHLSTQKMKDLPFILNNMRMTICEMG